MSGFELFCPNCNCNQWQEPRAPIEYLLCRVCKHRFHVGVSDRPPMSASVYPLSTIMDRQFLLRDDEDVFYYNDLLNARWRS